MRASVGQRGRISISLSTCSWSSANASVISAFWIGNTISSATASWYSGTGTPPRHWIAHIAAYRRGRLSLTSATWLPRRRPSACRPPASARTSSAKRFQVQVCQMPRSFSRIAGRPPRAWA